MWVLGFGIVVISFDAFLFHKDSQRFFTKDTKVSLPRIARIISNFLSLLSLSLLSLRLFLNRKVRKETKNVCFVNLNLFQILFSLRCWNRFSKTKSWRVNLVIFSHELALIFLSLSSLRLFYIKTLRHWTLDSFKSIISSSIISSSTFDFKTFDIWQF